jgi:hypothetical protein
VRRFVCALTIALLALTLPAQNAFGQGKGKIMKEFKSLGLGPFVFPIAGRFSVSQENGSSVLATEDNETRLTLSFFQFRKNAPERETLLANNEALLKRNWESFAKSENGKVVRQFGKLLDKPEFRLYAMSTEFIANGELQHYVQYGITDGPNLGAVFVEGFGKAEPVAAKYDTIFLKTTKVERQ